MVRCNSADASGEPEDAVLRGDALLEVMLEEAGLSLVADEHGLRLTDGNLSIRGDFSKMIARADPRRVGRELVVRAARVKGAPGPLLAIDATAGLGEDALLLAASGFDVRLYERNPVIAALLRDALERASDVALLSQAVARMTVVEGDSIELLPAEGARADVVLLDPMFPGRRKSAQVKKKLQLLQRLERPCDDEEALLEAALSVHPRKIIVKRPVKGPYLANRKPDYSLEGKAVRFDCIVSSATAMNASTMLH